MKIKKVDWSNKNFIETMVQESTTHSEVLRKLGLVPSSNMRTLKKYIIKYDLDISHFDKGRDQQRRGGHNKYLIDEILVENSPMKSGSNFKKRLLKENILEYKCRKCGNMGEWEKLPLVLQLEHKNGNSDDNRRENLEFLCPNCHSQTSTFCGKHNRTVCYETISDEKIIELARTSNNLIILIKKLGIPDGLGIREYVKHILSKHDLLRKFQDKTKTERIKKLIKQPNKKKFILTKEELVKLLWKFPSSKIAEMYDISDTLIVKYAKKWGLTKPPRGYWAKQYSKINSAVV